MLATNSVQLAGCTSPLPATGSDSGDMGFIEPGGLAISGLAVIDG